MSDKRVESNDHKDGQKIGEKSTTTQNFNKDRKCKNE